MAAKLVTLPPPARTLASARLRRALADAGLTQAEAAELVGKDPRQIRRWLSRRVPLGPLELLVLAEERAQRRAA